MTGTPMRAIGWALAGAVAALGVGLLVYGPIAQPESYHAFADGRSWLGVPNTLDVLSNVPFLVVGLAGLLRVAAGDASSSDALGVSFERRAFAVVFGALSLVAFGSAYYHWVPTTERLFWDRLPIAVVLTGILGIAIAERVGVEWGRRLFVPLVAIGATSTIVWRQSADLRLYVLVQAVTFVALPLLLLLPPRYTRTRDWIWMMGLYAAAKACEVWDRPIFDTVGLMSGHTLKHLLAAAGVGQLVRHLRLRRRA